MRKPVNQLIAQLYGAMGSPQDWRTMRSLFWKKAQLVCATPHATESYTLSQFIEWVEQDNPVDYHPEETQAITHFMGDVAHRASHYRAGERIGINSIQLLKIEGHWKIISLLWDTKGRNE